MKTHFLILSLLAAIASNFPLAQVTATEPCQPVETARSLPELSGDHAVAPEQDGNFVEGITVSEEAMMCEEAADFDALVDQRDASEHGTQEVCPGLGDREVCPGLGDRYDGTDCGAVSDKLGWDTGANDAPVEPLLDCFERQCEEIAVVAGDDYVNIVDEAATEDSEVAAELAVADQELAEELGWAEGYSEWLDVADTAVEELSEEAAVAEETVEETPEPAEAANVEGDIDLIDSAIAEPTSEPYVDVVETGVLEDAVDADAIAPEENWYEDEEDWYEDYAEVEEAELSGEEFAEGEAATEEAVGELEWFENFGAWFDEDESAAAATSEEEFRVVEPVEPAEAPEIADVVEAFEPVIEETVIEESILEESVIEDTVIEDTVIEDTVIEDTAIEESLTGGTLIEDVPVEEPVVDEADTAEPLEAEDLLPEVAEDVQYIIAGPSKVAQQDVDAQLFDDVAVDAITSPDIAAEESVVVNEESLDIVEPIATVTDVPETADEATVADDADDLAAGTVRTIELDGCSITVQSDRQVDDFELLDMLMEAVYQLEAEMD